MANTITAAPPPEPKAYTDEELQQRYGIHLATRIQKDDGGKQANWADIDDDDDDWAPESMEWADGTKMTLPQVEETVPEPPITIPSPALKQEIVTEPPKSQSPAPVASVLQPAGKVGGLGSGRTGLVLTKGPAEKPTLVAKPPGPPTPVKSPWASLPPVDKVAPIVIDVPQHQLQQQSRFGRTDPHGFQGMPPPAKEIAADDFSRTWRGDTGNSNRELFDSKSGRYEPVNDNRRGSRNDARHPSLLQRPHQMDGPAEPSAAFQTHRAGGESSYGRRRTSSNVSGGSGNLMRRMSRGQDMPPPHELHGPRRGSLAAVTDDISESSHSQSAPYPNHRNNSTTAWHQSKNSSAFNSTSPNMASVQPSEESSGVQAPPVKSYEEQLEEQKQIMRATREAAIKRRQEEEAKEESERKERLRLKLLALGPAPEKKGKKETPKEEKANPVPVQIQARTQETKQERIADAAESKAADVRSNSEEHSMTSKMVEEVDDNRANGIRPSSSSHLSSTQKPASESQSTQNWQNSTPSNSDRLHAPWAQQQSQQSVRNVWGPPTNDRSLGNGTFDTELNSVPDMTTVNPGPIGPPGRGNTYQQRGNREQPLTRQAPIGPPNRQTQRSAPDSRVVTSGWANAAQIIREDERRLHEDTAKIAALRKEQETLGLVKPVEAPVIKDTWRQVIIGEDGKRSKVVASHVSLHQDDQPLNIPRPNDKPTRNAYDQPLSELDPNLPRQFDAIGTQSRHTDRSMPSRSRFFPSQDVRLEQEPVEDLSVLSVDRSGSPPPPPPTMPGHPVYGDNAFPQVHLPKPAPIVKLPPAVLAPIGPPKPLSFAAAVATPIASPQRQVSQDIRRSDVTTAVGWQDRINNLMGRKPASPPRTHALQVDSASKNALDVHPPRFAATVSLPGSTIGDLSVDDDSIVSKPAAEECFEEQEMGSLPRVKVPAMAPAAAWEAAAPPKSGGRSLNSNDVATVSLDSMRSFYTPYITNNSISVVVRIPGLKTEHKTFTMPVPAYLDKRRPTLGGGRGGSRQPSRGGRNRDSSSNFLAPSAPEAGRGGRNRDTSNTLSTPTVPESGRGFNKDRKSSNWVRPSNSPRPITQT